MFNLTREKLIKTIVAEEMVSCSGDDYHKKLKSLYHKWEHESSENICKKYNELKKTDFTVNDLKP